MELHTNDFDYHLPEDKIALFPADQRELSKLLVYDGKTIQHKIFRDIVDVLPADCLLVFNNSKVVPARMHFKKESGAVIEIFVLGPENEREDHKTYFDSRFQVKCKCTIGNKKRWRNGTLHSKTIHGLEIKATLLDEMGSIVQFSWDEAKSWGEIIHQFGEVPLPPYIKRSSVDSDKERYQTVYSTEPGAVAAPTAGLHFTREILSKINSKGITTDYLTLHVGAGTFLPIKADSINKHNIHHEKLIFTRDNITCLLSHKGKIIPVGTTSSRSLESLYWFGNKLIMDSTSDFNISQEDPYKSYPNKPSRTEALEAIACMMDKAGLREIQGSTSLYIYPGYTFRMTDSLITNFHQPKSTLILLVAALIGEDWRKVYKEALKSGYRFLSYGDSSFLIPLH